MTVREGQIRLCHTMLDALFGRDVALCDAGVGLGKTYAYLVACVLWQLQRPRPMQRPVVISTASITLQNAILEEYIPFLSDALIQNGYIQAPVCAVLRKGKERFVCDVRLLIRQKQITARGKRFRKRATALQEARQCLDLDRLPNLPRHERRLICVPSHCGRSCIAHTDCRYRQYMKGVKDANPNMACTIKHFPGDGVEELDQHLVMGVNSLSVADWEASFGKVYRTLINEGAEAIMVGHIALPAMSRKLRPGIQDKDIKPATLAPELLTDLLRQDMGFNGVIITDASHMVGITATAKRENSVPGAIIAGCDMFLFANDIDEDISFLRAAYDRGDLTEERLSDALHRVLGLKAKLHLNEQRMPDKSALDCIGCEEHKAYTAQAADSCITLVKDTRNYLPMDPKTKKRVFLVYVGSTPTTKGYKGDPAKQVVIEELERAGFEVDVCPNFHALEIENGVSPMNFVKILSHAPRADFVKTHDWALIVVNVKGYAQENNVRLRWSCNHSMELPWYNEEVPTVAMSLNYTNHLIDLPQVHTFINAYAPNRTHIRAAIEKITGQSEFKGKAEDNVFCGRWDTRL